ncbi:hypothetical protein Peur_060999 [Populus x canadensis]
MFLRLISSKYPYYPHIPPKSPQLSCYNGYVISDHKKGKIPSQFQAQISLPQSVEEFLPLCKGLVSLDFEGVGNRGCPLCCLEAYIHMKRF